MQILGDSKRGMGDDPSSTVTRRMNQAIADRVVVKLPVEFAEFAVTTVSGTIIDRPVTANDCFDPLGATGSAQPMYFDQWALQYMRYRVLASKITVRATQNNGTAQHSGDLYVFLSENGTAVTALSQLNQVGVKRGNWTGSTPCVVRNYTTIQKISGQPNVADYAQALTTASPSDVIYWHVAFYPHDSDTTSLSLTIKLEFEVEFFERRPQSDALGLIKTLLLNNKLRREYLALKAAGKTEWQQKQAREAKEAAEVDYAAELDKMASELKEKPSELSLQAEPEWEELSAKLAKQLLSMKGERKEPVLKPEPPTKRT